MTMMMVIIIMILINMMVMMVMMMMISQSINRLLTYGSSNEPISSFKIRA